MTTYIGSSGKDDTLTFTPDVVWMKQRNSGGGTNDHVIVDSVRGRCWYPSENYSENTSAADKDLMLPRNGFYSTGPTNQSAVNRGSRIYYVAWCWKYTGGSKNTFNVDGVGYATTTAAGLTDGSMSPSGASVGTKQDFLY